jgi:hypothetical protein
MIPLRVHKFGNKLLAFFLAHRHPAYARRVQHSPESPSNLGERINAGRRRVAEEEAERARSRAGAADQTGRL